jgi:hypothetical protein
VQAAVADPITLAALPQTVIGAVTGTMIPSPVAVELVVPPVPPAAGPQAAVA